MGPAMFVHEPSLLPSDGLPCATPLPLAVPAAFQMHFPSARVCCPVSSPPFSTTLNREALFRTRGDLFAYEVKTAKEPISTLVRMKANWAMQSRGMAGAHSISSVCGEGSWEEQGSAASAWVGEADTPTACPIVMLTYPARSSSTISHFPSVLCLFQAEVHLLVTREEAPEVYDLEEDDSVEVGPFRGSGLDLRGSGILAVYQYQTVRVMKGTSLYLIAEVLLTAGKSNPAHTHRLFTASCPYQ